MKPMLFNTDMVRAILDGRKTVTRRVVKPQPVFRDGETGTPVQCDDGNWHFKIDQYDGIYDIDLKPPYRSGDILYVRETWASAFGTFFYKADQKRGMKNPGKWRPSIHMPKEAARIFLRVTSVRVERLQDMTEQDCANDGVYAIEAVQTVGIAPLFGYLWDSTIKPADRALYSWEANPWVWVIEFERVSKEEALKNV